MKKGNYQMFTSHCLKKNTDAGITFHLLTLCFAKSLYYRSFTPPHICYTQHHTSF